MSDEIKLPQLPKLGVNQKTFAGIPEAVFIVSFYDLYLLLSKHNLKCL